MALTRVRGPFERAWWTICALTVALLAAAPILLLDESTSSLDGMNEQLLRKAIDAVAVDRTLIVIAHRLSTVVDSYQIVVLDHGRVAETGTHDDLLAAGGRYAMLVARDADIEPESQGAVAGIA